MSIQETNSIFKLASIGIEATPEKIAEIIHEDWINDTSFNEALYEVLSIIETQNGLSTVPLESRFALAFIYHWANKNLKIKQKNINRIFENTVRHFDTRSSTYSQEFIFELIPKDGKNELIENIFGFFKPHLIDRDYQYFLNGMSALFKYALKTSIQPDQTFSLPIVYQIAKKFNEGLKEEIEGKQAMSFSFEDEEEETRVILSSWEMYRIYLNALIPIVLDTEVFDSVIRNFIIQRILLETNLTISTQLIDSFITLYKKQEKITDKIVLLKKKLKTSSEEEQEQLLFQLRRWLIRFFDQIELSIYLRHYESKHKGRVVAQSKPISKLIQDFLSRYKSGSHFIRYYLIKLFEFHTSNYFPFQDLQNYLEEVNKTVTILQSEETAIPDDEMRFFIDRTLKNSSSIHRFIKLNQKFRGALDNVERFKTIHDQLEVGRMNKRHASALLSFYLAAMIEVDFGELIPMPLIEDVANRLGSTFSITRRFDIARYVEDILADREKVQDLLSKGELSGFIQKEINKKELELAFNQYLTLSLFFPDYNNAPDERSKYIEMLVNESQQSINEQIGDAFKDILEEASDEAIVKLFAENKIVALLAQELDGRRRDESLKNYNRENIRESIQNFTSDSRAMYEAEREIKKISLTELHVTIQRYNRMIAIVLGDIQNELEDTMEIIDADDDATLEHVKTILGGIAIHHRGGKLNFEAVGINNLLEEMGSDSNKFYNLAIETLNGEHGEFEVKNEQGKTRTVNAENFDTEIDIIKELSSTNCISLFKNVILVDLLQEVFDALASCRDMAKNSRELKDSLDDIALRSKDLLDLVENRYTEMMNSLYG